MNTETMKWEVLDDSNSDNQGQQVFQSNDREAANVFYSEYEKVGNKVGYLRRNPQWQGSYENSKA